MGLDGIINLGKKVVDPFGVLERTIGGVGKDLGFGGNKDAGPTPTPLPQPPSQDAATQNAQDSTNKKRVAMSQTVFTDPLGVGGQANIVRKTLTGQ